MYTGALPFLLRDLSCCVKSSRSSTSETGYLLRLLACLGALLALRLAAVYAAETDLVLDEAQYWTWSRELAFGYFSKPPMIAWVIRGASESVRQSEACLRSASPVLYTLAAFMIYLDRARALRSPRVGFWSAIVFATLPGVSYSSLLITTDVPLVLFWTHRALRLGDAGEAAKHGASPSCSVSRSASVSSPSRR